MTYYYNTRLTPEDSELDLDSIINLDSIDSLDSILDSDSDYFFIFFLVFYHLVERVIVLEKFEYY